MDWIETFIEFTSNNVSAQNCISVCVWMKLGELQYHLSRNGYTLTRIGRITENRPLQHQHLPVVGHLGINVLYLAVLMMTNVLKIGLSIGR